jgi:hypothetical protein
MTADSAWISSISGMSCSSRSLRAALGRFLRVGTGGRRHLQPPADGTAPHLAQVADHLPGPVRGRSISWATMTLEDVRPLQLPVLCAELFQLVALGSGQPALIGLSPADPAAQGASG